MRDPLHNLYTVTKLFPKCYWASFRNQTDMTLTFLRVAEYGGAFEGKHRVFTLDEYRQWYAEEVSSSRRFSYHTDWHGFCLQGWQFLLLYRRLRRHIRDWSMYDLAASSLGSILHANNGSWDFTLVITRKDDVKTLRHEAAHALWSKSFGYRKAQKNVLRKAPQYARRAVEEALSRAGYLPNEIDDDEVHASLIDVDPHPVVSQVTRAHRRVLKPIQASLRATLDRRISALASAR